VNAEDIRGFCLGLPNVEESFPFGHDVLVFKASGKIFLLLNLVDQPLQFNVKCDPLLAIEYREKYPAVRPGYHMNKKHWNTVYCDGSLSSALLFSMIQHSHTLVDKQKKPSPVKRRNS
jgi:predicted DNA-binding protein (MmcQ/YjbR family)